MDCMHMNARTSSIIGLLHVLALTVLLLLPCPPCGAAVATAPTGKTAGGQNRFVTIDFNDVDIDVFIKFISELTGKNFVVDNRVRGKVTIISPTKISVDEAYRVFESVLEVNGFTTVPAGKVIKIIPSPEARSKDLETRTQGPRGFKASEKPNDKMITQLIPLSYADARDVKQLFTPLVSRNSVILAYEATNTLIVTDVQSNIDRLLRILKVIDTPGIGQEIAIIPLHYADSEKMEKTLEAVFKPERAARAGQNPFERVKFISDPRTNSIIAVASEKDLIRIKRLVQLLDQETPRGKGKIHVYYLENATAEDVAKVLTQLPQKGTGGTPRGSTGGASVISGNVRITADKATNSLIIMANPEDYQVLKDVIQKLDIPRSMVYIEALIMEVDLQKSFNLGIKWSIFGNSNVGGKSTGIGGGFGSGDGGFSIGASDLTDSGLSLGMISGDTIQVTVDGTVMNLPNLSAVANAFKSDKDVNILSTPQVLTTDNEEATIIVASNIPYKTQSSASSAVSGEVFNSYEYRDVGFTLKITPHISKDRLVRLKISQEYTAVDTAQGQKVTDTPSTLKRSVDTTVIVQDRHTVVIGGLINDKLSDTVDKVPCLGDVPFLGRLFRNDSRGNEKTDLYIFITPRVIKNPEEAEAIMKEKSQGIDRTGNEQIKLYDPAHPHYLAPPLVGSPDAPPKGKKSSP